jgi:hypothetical protein
VGLPSIGTSTLTRAWVAMATGIVEPFLPVGLFQVVNAVYLANRYDGNQVNPLLKNGMFDQMKLLFVAYCLLRS